ncbi:DNA methyltransferase [Oerskovia sp. NPDC060338]|jgi:site-specific DNA-methyltransferase (adenine-specific)|uniref:DNA methyltransferase n=1 Tax=Oerskovia sp. NPDC060338 TaxID=3347100 RepID=UPI003649A207
MSPFEHVHGNALDSYPAWPGPDVIMSDGAYGVRGFHGDTVGPEGLVDWYRLHIEAWSAAAKPSTTLWFWNTEVGWANVHPVLEANGWRYVQTVTWDKGISHVAGNVNGRTIRRLPVVSEVVVLYERDLVLESDIGPMQVQEWLRHEWQRSGLPLYKSNEACGVKNAATRKYLTKDWLFYFPPGEMVERMAAYCTEHGRVADRPYFSIDGLTVPIAKEWDGLRRVWNHQHALTNVWQRPSLHDSERLKGSMRRAAPRVYKPTGTSAAHLNQKPLDLMERLIAASSQPGDVVWEPFGGLASGSVAAVALGRRAYVSELDAEFARVGRERLEIAAADADANAEQVSLAGGAERPSDTGQ